MVHESIETRLAASQATDRPAWAAVSTTGLRALEAPPEVREVTVHARFHDVGATAAWEAGRQSLNQGRPVHTAHPGNGLDLDDLLLRGVHRTDQSPL